jgi:hypothetical protein
MLSFHALPCLFLGITVDTKETRDPIAFEAFIFGTKTHNRKEANFDLYLALWITLVHNILQRQANRPCSVVKQH